MKWLLRTCLVVLVVCMWPVPAPTSASQSNELSGKWLMAQLTTTVSRIPIIGDIYAETHLVSVHDLRHEGNRLHGAGSLCRLELRSGSRFVRAGFSERTKSYLPLPMVDAQLSRNPKGQMTMWQPGKPSVVGARLRNPSRDPLPTRPDAPEVVDEDRDGHPGLTIEVRGIASGQVYVVQRSWTALSGQMVSANEFAGKLRFGNEQVVLDATSFRLRRTPATEPVPSRSWFRLQRLPEQANCKAALAQAEGWFP